MNQIAWYLKPLFWLQKRKYGAALESAKIWATSPRIFLGLSTLFGSLERRSSPISPQLRSLIFIRVSQLNGCEFCIDLNTSVLLKRGISIKKAEQVIRWKKSSLFNQKEKLVLEYAEAVTDSSKKISPSLTTKMHKQFNEAEIVELTAISAFQNMSTKFNNAFNIKPQGFCSFEKRGKSE